MGYNLRRLIFVFFFFTLLFPGSFCQADDRAKDRATLRGIQSVIVKVHSWEPEWREELNKVGLEESNLQALVEHKLEKAGIPVLSEEAAKKSETEGILNIRMKLLEPEPAIKTYKMLDENEVVKIDTKKKYVYAIRLNFRQMVLFPRLPDRISGLGELAENLWWSRNIEKFYSAALKNI